MPKIQKKYLYFFVFLILFTIFIVINNRFISQYYNIFYYKKVEVSSTSVEACYKSKIDKKDMSRMKNQEIEYVKNNIEVTPQTIFVFDVNDVIIDPDFSKIWKVIKSKIFSNHKFQLTEALLRPYLYYTVIKHASKGCLPEEIITKIKQVYPKYETLTAHALELANSQKEVPGMFQLINKLNKNGHVLLLLTNISCDKEHFSLKSSIDMLKEEFPIFDLFDFDASMFTTKHNGYLRKPYPLFFEKFLEKFVNKFGQERVKDIIFIDDRIKNVLAAREFGIKAVLFISSDDLIDKLKI